MLGWLGVRGECRAIAGDELPYPAVGRVIVQAEGSRPFSAPAAECQAARRRTTTRGLSA